MAVRDEKVFFAFVQAVLEIIDSVEENDAEAQVIITKYQNKSPNLNGTGFTVQDVADGKSFLDGIGTLISDHSSIIAKFKNNRHESHGKGLLG